mmetsp:Transcript_60911/g.176164  ORF Transcript_60911/g.176164 Transcript_60911/m.176164 type:complete len:258 (+) Transcript_60911:683-1456(+)
MAPRRRPLRSSSPRSMTPLARPPTCLARSNRRRSRSRSTPSSAASAFLCAQPRRCSLTRPCCRETMRRRTKALASRKRRRPTTRRTPRPTNPMPRSPRPRRGRWRRPPRGPRPSSRSRNKNAALRRPAFRPPCSSGLRRPRRLAPSPRRPCRWRALRPHAPTRRLLARPSTTGPSLAASLRPSAPLAARNSRGKSSRTICWPNSAPKTSHAASAGWRRRTRFSCRETSCSCCKPVCSNGSRAGDRVLGDRRNLSLPT